MILQWPSIWVHINLKKYFEGNSSCVQKMLVIKYFRIILFDFYSSVGLWNFKESSRLKGALARNKMKDKSEKGTNYQQDCRIESNF